MRPGAWRAWGAGLVIVLSLLPLAACRRRGAVATSTLLQTPDARWVERLRRVAMRDLDCPEIWLSPVGPVAFRATGCGRSSEYAHSCQGRRCRWDGITPAIVQGERLLACSRASIEARAEGETMLLDGCGRSARLRLECDLASCRWLGQSPPPPASYLASAPPSSLGGELVLPSRGGPVDGTVLPSASAAADVVIVLPDAASSPSGAAQGAEDDLTLPR